VIITFPHAGTAKNHIIMQYFLSLDNLFSANFTYRSLAGLADYLRQWQSQSHGLSNE